MPRPRKISKFQEVLEPLSVADLKVLKADIAAEIRAKENAVVSEKRAEQALKIRDKVRIGKKITFRERGTGGGVAKAEVIGIFTDKVQVEVGGRKRSIALTRVESID